MPTIVVVLVIIYFIREQFSFGTVGRLEYIIIPIFALYQFLAVFKATQMDFVLLAIIAIISILISRFQANGSRVRIEKVATYWIDNDQGEQPIYKKQVTSQGGRRYLLGWGAIVLIQIILELFFGHEVLNGGQIWGEVFKEIISDMFAWVRLGDAGQGSWYIWALTGISSASYTYWMARKSPAFRSVILKESHTVDYEEEK